VQMLAGFSVRQEILYAVTAVEKMPEAAVLALRQGRIDAALFFSPRSASVFRHCAEQENLATDSVIAVCISSAAAAALAPLAFRRLLVPAKPNAASLLEALD
jgi:uroporphyrinogen-III synthase